MPVVVTGASGLIGRSAVVAFARGSPEVRAYVRRPEAGESLRTMDAKVAVGPIEDADTLAVVMRGAHTVCHLVGGLDLPDEVAYERVNVGSTMSVVEAAKRAGVTRILFVSYPGASPSAGNPYLRAKGLAEQVVAGSGLEHAILRCTHVYGRGSDWLQQTRKLARGWPAVVLGSGRQILAPVFADDVAAVLAAADDRRQTTSGTWGLEGPDRLSADDFADLLAGKARRKVHLAGRGAQRAARFTGRRVSAVALEVLEADSLADAPDAAAEFGVELTLLREGLERAAGAVLER
jgi:NADH dehydrogenase